MRVVYKYPLPVKLNVKIEMPIGADVLMVDAQDENLFLWALVETRNKNESVTFHVFETGETIFGNGHNRVFVGSVNFKMRGNYYAYHVFKDV